MIVDVASDKKYARPDENPMPIAPYDYQQADSIDDRDIEVSATPNSLTIVRAVRGVLREINTNLFCLHRPKV